MVKIIFTGLLAILYCSDGFSQNGYHVTYQNTVTFQGRTDTTFYNLVFNDSMGYAYINNTRPQSKKYYQIGDSIFGGNFINHHDGFYVPSSNQYLTVVAASARKKHFRRMRPTYYSNFIVEKDSLVISGLDCQKGYVVKPSGHKLYAVIAKDLKYPYGPFAFAGLPGLIVEMYDSEFKFYAIMTNIVAGNYYITQPDLPVKNIKEYEKQYGQSTGQ